MFVLPPLSSMLMAVTLAGAIGITGLAIMSVMMVAIVACISLAVYLTTQAEQFKCFLGGILGGFELGMGILGVGFNRIVGLLVSSITGQLISTNNLIECATG